MRCAEMAPKRAKPATGQPAANLLLVGVHQQFADGMEDRRPSGNRYGGGMRTSISRDLLRERQTLNVLPDRPSDAIRCCDEPAAIASNGQRGDGRHAERAAAEIRPLQRWGTGMDNGGGHPKRLERSSIEGPEAAGFRDAPGWVRRVRP
jgi:hypothetical protein